MATIVLKWADVGGNGNIITPDCAGCEVQNVYELDLAAAPLLGVALPANTIIDLGLIPANTTVTDVTLVGDDLDSGTALAYDIGVITGTPGDAVGSRTCGQEFFVASTLSQAGGVSRMSAKTGFRVAPVGYDRSIGLKITTAATGLATTGKLAVIVELKG